MEEEQKSWIIEGFPRTEMQAVALQKMGIIPNKIVMLSQDDEQTLASLIEKLIGGFTGVKCDDPDQLKSMAFSAAMEYKL
jgi:adenylate kinase family enzyme